MSIRKADLTDIGRIGEFLSVSIREEYHDTLPPEAIPIMLDFVRRRISSTDGAAYVSEEGTTLIGMGSIGPSEWWKVIPGILQIDALYVASTHQRLGHGKALLDHMLTKHPARSHMAWVLDDGLAKPFWEKMGFRAGSYLKPTDTGRMCRVYTKQ